MRFTLEALPAKHGDCLLLHYGSAGHKIILIDGGPSDVYTEVLRPRLQELRTRLVGDGKRLPIQVALVSHIDDDHINGMLQLTKELREAQEGEADQEDFIDIHHLWHNSFDDLVQRVSPTSLGGSGGAASFSLASAAEEIPASATKSLRHDTQLVLASVKQGRDLMVNARFLVTPLNEGFDDGLILAPATGVLRRAFGKALSFTFLGPQKAQLDKLQDEWAKWIAKQDPSKLTAAKAADYLDKSPYNLSSIIVLAECGGRRMLLTGDARGDHILDGLHASGLKKPGDVFHLDILKMPHHGSWRNTASEFLEEITADHYVFSADGRHDNPDVETIQELYKARGDAEYSLHFTNERHHSTGRVLPAVTYARRHRPDNVEVITSDESRTVPAIVIDLGDPLDK